MRPRVCWVVKIGELSYWEGPRLQDIGGRSECACEFTRIEMARAVARTVCGRVVRRTRRKSK